jgi:serine/threonine protein phosphatase PrpC
MHWYCRMKKLNFYSDFDEHENDEYNVSFNAISVKGERHQKNNECNQDYFRCNVKNNIKYAIVADGLGSAKQSHIGSEKAVELLENMIQETLNNDVILSETEITEFNKRLIEKWKVSFPDQMRDYDTTLLYLIIFKHGVLVGSIGDGLILYSMKNEVVYIKEGKNSFSNQTYSLASHQALDYFTSIYQPITFKEKLPIVFILATDGVSDDLKPEMVQELPAYLYEEFRGNGVVKMQNIIGSWILNWETQHHSDDRTFCILTMWKAGEQE